MISLYKSRHGDEENNRKLLNLIKEISELDGELKLICSYFNKSGIDYKFWMVKAGYDKFCCNFIENLRDCFFYQHVDEVTRFRDRSVGNVLDLIISNEEYFIDKVEIECYWKKRSSVTLQRRI